MTSAPEVIAEILARVLWDMEPGSDEIADAIRILEALHARGYKITTVKKALATGAQHV
jgi:hypothetical protein